MDKLGEIATQAEKFLRELAKDARVEAAKGEWLAVNFSNSSVAYDAEFQGEASDAEAQNFNRALRYVAEYEPGQIGNGVFASEATILEYARIGQIIHPDEVIEIGIYDGRKREPKEWKELSYQRSAQIREDIETPILSYGSVQGIIHSLYKEADRPYFRIRELSTENLVSCIYGSKLYGRVADALKEKTAIVHITGHIILDRATRAVREVRAERIDVAEALSDVEFEKFFGSAPDLTGDMTTDEFIDLLREDGE